jgi:hypothetical protein
MSRYRIYLTLLTMMAGLAGCAATTDLSAPPTRSAYVLTSPDSVIAPLPTTLRPMLTFASRGLLYTSESDYPFAYFRHAVPNRPATTALSIAEFRALLGIPAATPVEIISLDTFFARHIERVDPFDDVAQALVPRYVLLRETLRSSLSQVVVYRVGRIAIDCYVVGFNVNADLEGLSTISIET